MLLPEKQLSTQAANLLLYFFEQVRGPWLGDPVIFSVLISTVADTQTTLLPAWGLTLSMACDGVFPASSQTSTGEYQTPLLTLVLAGLPLLGIGVRAAIPTVNAANANLINDFGILVAVYYGASGLGCAWA